MSLKPHVQGAQISSNYSRVQSHGARDSPGSGHDPDGSGYAVVHEGVSRVPTQQRGHAGGGYAPFGPVRRDSAEYSDELCLSGFGNGPEQHQCLDRDYGNQRPGPVAEADRAWTVGEFGSAGSGSEYGSLDYCIQGDHGDEQSVADECDRDVRRSGSAFTSH